MDKQTGKFSLQPEAIQVWYQLPDTQSSNTPIVFVMHGLKRNAEQYRNDWIELAKEHNYIVVVPEFDKKRFPKSRCFNQGNILNKEDELNSEDQWSFSYIARIFSQVKEKQDNKTKKFYIYGHSAGSQFVHRLLMFKPDLPVALAVAANAGWYTLPWSKRDFPYGFSGKKNPPVDISNFLSKPMVILLGEKDNDPNERYLETNKDNEEHGPHRYARGKFFFEKAKELAKNMDVEFNWHLEIVPGVAHEPERMAPFAAKVINEHLAENSCCHSCCFYKYCMFDLEIDRSRIR